VPDSKDFQQRIQRIGELVQQLEGAGDPALRGTAKELVKLLMDLHGGCLERMMEISFQSGEGARLIDDFGRDSLVSSLLILYGLHPDDLTTRVSRAVEHIRPQLRKHDAEVEVLGIEGESVRLRIAVGAHACGSTAASVRTMVEQAVYEAAPDVSSLNIEGAEGKAASGFVSVAALLNTSANPAAALASESGD